MEAIRIETGARPSAAVLWLHGLGADGHDFEPIVPELELEGLAVRFVFPHAPVRPVTLNGGMTMRAWYDILQLGPGPEDEKGIQASQRLLEQLVEEQKQEGIGPERIVLAGFSQGGAIALQTALRHPARLAGLMALSTYLPVATTLAREKSESNRKLPIFMAHGTYDDVIPLQRAEDSRRMLEAEGYAVEWRTYPMPHSVCGPEIADVSAFLRRVLA
jgi:phospholipase/carboxylesterase